MPNSLKENLSLKFFIFNSLKFFIVVLTTLTLLIFSLKVGYAYFTVDNTDEGIELDLVTKIEIENIKKQKELQNTTPRNLIQPEANISTTKSSTESYVKAQDAKSFYTGLKFNEYTSLFFITGDNGYSYTYYSPIAAEFVDSKIDKPSIEKLVQLKSIFDLKSEELKTKPQGRDLYVSHVGIAFAKDDVLSFNNTILGDTEITLPDDVNFEISKVLFADGIVYLGLANTFTGNGRTFGDIFIKIDIDTAIKKLEKAFLASVVVTDVQYWWNKTMNIIAGANFAKDNYKKLSGTVDVNDAIALKQGNIAGYVPGSAVIANEIVNDVLAGGVCHFATVWNTAVRMGLDTYEVKYKVLQQDKHRDLAVRYIPNTLYPYLNEDIYYYDVTVFYSPEYGSVGSITQIEEGKTLDIKITPLIEDPSTARFFAVIETKLEK